MICLLRFFPNTTDYHSVTHPADSLLVSGRSQEQGRLTSRDYIDQMLGGVGTT